MNKSRSSVLLRVREIQFYERDVVFRMPFRFGVITLTEEPQIFVRLRVELSDGKSAWGSSAEVLGPKWFDKNPLLSNEQNYDQLRTSLDIASQLYLGVSGSETPFGLFQRNYRSQIGACKQLGLNALIASYGPALLDRAVLDAVCRLLGISFFDAIIENLPGIQPMQETPELSGFDFRLFLRDLQVLRSLHARHTVGLVDPITAEDLSESERLNDGLPETLDEVINFYANKYYKLKLSGDPGEDLDRLRRIAASLDRQRNPYYVTLDGNEQFSNADALEDLWGQLKADPKLNRLIASVLWIEQPIRREAAFNRDVSRLSAERPVIIDESDEDLDAFPKATHFGYRGVSSKQCKGIYKSFINLARCVTWNQKCNEPRYLMSGEDLTTQPGLAVQQDLALVAMLGLGHLERNGHHYVRGMEGLSDREQNAFLSAHPDLYVREQGLVRIRIQEGEMSIGSLECAGFAADAEPDWSAMRRTR